MKHRCRLLSFLIVTLFLSACGASKHGGRHNVLSETSKLDFAFNYFEGSKNKMLGNTDRALDHYLQCIRIDGSNDGALYEAAMLFAAKGKFDNALYFMKAAATIEPDNIWYQLHLAELYQNNKLFPEAVKVYEKLIKSYPERIDFYHDLAEALVYSGKYAEAIKVYDRLESQTSISPETSVQKEKLYLRLDKFDKAVEEIQKLISAYPTDQRYYGLLAELYQASGMNEKAREILKKMEELDPENPLLHLSLAEYYRSNNEKEKSFGELKLAFASPRLDLDTKVAILSSYYNLIIRYPELKPQALELNKILVEAHPTEARAFSVYGDFLTEDKKYESARDQYRKAITLDKQSFTVWQQLFVIELELNDYKSLRNESEDAKVLFPSQPLVFFFNGVARLQLKEYNDALEALQTGQKLVVDNDKLMVQFYSNIGEVYNHLKKIPESDQSFEKAIALDPSNANVLNNYSYYLSLRSDSLDKAERMSLQANQLEPNNASYQDTYGWILYKQDKFADAKQWIEKAIAGAGTKNAVILEHYGDVLWKLQMNEKAIEYWKKAGEAGQGSDFLERKIAEKKLFE